MKIEVKSLQNMIEYAKYATCDEPTLVISIQNSCFKKSPCIFEKNEQNNIIRVIYVFADDISEDGIPEPNFVTLSDEDAARIACAVYNCRHKVNKIIVHCSAGVSRSAGVAAAIGKWLNNDDSFIFDCGMYRPNMTFYRKVLNALVEYHSLKIHNNLVRLGLY